MVAAHQPGYLSNLAFFYKMARTDVFVLADDVQYTTNHLINRAKIKTAAGATWLTVPVLTKGRAGQLINQVQINPGHDWRKKHWKNLMMNYNHAAYFELYFEFFENLYRKEWRYLIDLNLETIDYLAARLNLRPRIVLSSSLNVRQCGREWLMKIMEKLAADVYLTESAFQAYLSREDFAKRGLQLNFMAYRDPIYHQMFGEFISGLSVIDLLFNEGEMSYEILNG